MLDYLMTVYEDRIGYLVRKKLKLYSYIRNHVFHSV